MHAPRYVLTPGILASVLQLLVALVVNNLSCHRDRWYPQYWAPARYPPPEHVGRVAHADAVGDGTDHAGAPATAAPASVELKVLEAEER